MKEGHNMSLIKDDMAKYLAQERSITKIEASKIIDDMFEFIIKANEVGEKVQIVGFGSFEPRVSKAHKGINPITKDIQLRPEKIFPKFKAGTAYKKRVNHE